MNNSKLINAALVLAILAGLTCACYNDNEEDLYPFAKCDTSNVTYALSVVPILSANCYSCHSGPNPSGGIRLDTYSAVDSVAKNGWLSGAINHSPGFVPMPKNGGSLGSCDLSKMNTWIRNGSPNN